MEYMLQEDDKMKHRAFLSLGSNIGNREFYLQQALKQLIENKIYVTDFSSVYETNPVGVEGQNDYLNMVVEVHTDYGPRELLEKCLSIEKELGRERVVHWGPRTIDIDIILYDDLIMDSEDLIIPHPRMQERGFVLIPLAEIDHSVHLPGLNKTAGELVETISKEGVRLWKRKSGEDVSVLFGS